MRLLLLLLSLPLWADLCYFTPPEGWLLAKPQSDIIKIGFLHPGGHDFPPRITLATEENSGTLKQYVKAVKEIQSQDPSHKSWRDLGAIKAGPLQGRLIEMQSSSQAGDVKILQAFFVKNDTAYILTASLLKKEDPEIQTQILKTFQSAAIVPDLLSPIKNREQKEKLSALLKQKNKEQVASELTHLSDLGPYWQFLILDSLSK